MDMFTGTSNRSQYCGITMGVVISQTPRWLQMIIRQVQLLKDLLTPDAFFFKWIQGWHFYINKGPEEAVAWAILWFLLSSHSLSLTVPFLTPHSPPPPSPSLLWLDSLCSEGPASNHRRICFSMMDLTKVQIWQGKRTEVMGREHFRVLFSSLFCTSAIRSFPSGLVSERFYYSNNIDSHHCISSF